MRGIRSIDGIQNHQVTATQTQPASSAARQVGPRPYQFAPSSQPRSGFMQRFQLTLLVGAGIIAGYLVQSLWFGVAAIVLYGILSIIFRVDSRVTFALAFISLLTVPILLVAKSNTELANNFATYTFLLLVFGVIALSFEAMPQGRRRKRRNGR